MNQVETDFKDALKNFINSDYKDREDDFFVNLTLLTRDSEEIKINENFKITSVVSDKREGEGGPSQQEFVIKVDHNGEDIFFKFIAEWVSWDGMYYESTLNSARQVYEKKVLITVYE